MHLTSGKSMARASSSFSQPSSKAQSFQVTTPLGDLNVSTVVGATMAMPVSTETGVTAPSPVSTSSPMTRPEMGTSVPHSLLVFLQLPVSQVLLQSGLGLMIKIQMCRTFLGTNRMVCQL